MVFGATSWAVAWLVVPHIPVPSAPGAAWPIVQGLGVLQDQWLCFTYIGAVLLLVVRQPAWAQRLEGVGLAGRMALTNYLLQCAVLDVLASGYGLRLRVNPLTGLIAGTLLFVVFAAISRWWLTRFRYGPLEWVWRSATYLSVPAIARAASSAQG